MYSINSRSDAYMPTLLLLDTSSLKVFVRHREVPFHLLQRLVSDGINSKLLLALSEVQPQPAPGRVSRSLAKEVGHLQAAIAARQRCLICIILRVHLERYHRNVQRCPVT